MKRLLSPSAALAALCLVALPATRSEGQGGEKPSSHTYQKYPSKFKKRGDVHGLVFALPQSTVYEGVVRAFANLGLTVNTEFPALGFLEGGRSRGIAGETVRVWVDPEGEGKYRVEVRNIRISRMGLIGLATTKDWSKPLLEEVGKVLGDAPTLDKLRASVEADESSLERRRQLIEAYLASAMPEDALKAYKALLESHPDSVMDRMTYADLLLTQGQTDSAMEALSGTADKDPEAAFALARILVQTGEATAALELLAPLREKNPSDLKARYHVGRAALLAGDASRAKAELAAVIEQAPQHPFAAQSKAWLQIAPSGAVPDKPEPKLTSAVGEQLAKEGMPLLARRYLEEALASSPAGWDKDRAYTALTNIYMDQKDYSAIVRCLEPEANRLSREKRGELLNTLALAHCGMRNFQAALNYAKKAKKAGHKPADALEGDVPGGVESRRGQ